MLLLSKIISSILSSVRSTLKSMIQETYLKTRMQLKIKTLMKVKIQAKLLKNRESYLHLQSSKGRLMKAIKQVEIIPEEIVLYLLIIGAPYTRQSNWRLIKSNLMIPEIVLPYFRPRK